MVATHRAAGVVLKLTNTSLDELTRFDPERLEDLCRKIGEVRAEAEVALALRRISEGLSKLPDLLETDDQAFLREVDQLRKDSDLIGMLTLSRVARGVVNSFVLADQVALAATLARLQRVGNRSIHAVWDQEDLSG